MAATIGAALIDLKNRSRMSLTAIAAAAGYSGASSVQAFFNASYDPPALDVTIAKRLVQAFQGKGHPPIGSDEIYRLLRVDEGVSAAKEGQRRNQLESDVPVYRTAHLAGSAPLSEPLPGLSLLLGNFREPYRYYPRASGLAWSDDAFALHMVGNSMGPRFRDGEPVFLDPIRAPAAGDDVMVRLWANGEIEGRQGYDVVAFGYLNRFEADTVTVTQYRTDRSTVIPTRLINRVERIIRWAEVCGLSYA